MSATADRSRTTPTLLVAAAAALTLVLWASVYSAIKVSLVDFSIWQLAFLRMAAASVTLALVTILTGAKLPDRKHWPALSAVGVVGFAIYPVLLNLGQRTVEAGTASFVINATPAIAALLAVIFLKERFKLAGVVGITISFSGVLLIILSGGKQVALDFSAGAFVLLIAAFAHAAHFVMKKATLRSVTAFQVTAMSVWTGTIVLLPFAPDAVGALAAARADTIAAMLYLGVFCSAIGYLTWGYVLKHTGAATSSSLLALIPPLAVVIGAIWLGELPGPLAFVGGALTIAGVLIVQLKGQ